MTPAPIYTPDNTRPVHKIRYGWSGWLNPGDGFPKNTGDTIDACIAPWRKDGLALDDWHTEDHRIQCLFTTATEVSPALCASRAKGRVQCALRRQGTPVKFTRRVGLRSLGDNTREIVARKHGHQIAELAIMPDHIHCSLRGNHEQSPQEIGLCFLNNLAYVLGYNRCWSEEFYVGTFSEYAVDAILRKRHGRKQ